RGGAVPRAQDAKLGFEKVGDLVEGEQVVRPSLVVLLVARVLAAAQLDAPVVVGEHWVRRADAVGAPLATRRADKLLGAVADEGELRVLSAQDQRLLVRCEREADDQVGLATTSRAAVEEDVGERGEGELLRLVL